MKNTIRTPAPNQIYEQKFLYQQHIRKLQKIREERKTQLIHDSSRMSKHQQIKHTKSKSFAHRYNEQHNQITQENIKLLNKLQKVKPFSRHTSFTTYEKDILERKSLTPLDKKRIVQTEKQNNRLYVKMKSVSSNLSKDKLIKDFLKTQQIKSRISRYSTAHNKVILKSQQFLNTSGSYDKKLNLTSHYNPNEILKNKIQNRINIRKKQKYINNSQVQINKQASFFATQPQKAIKNKRKQINKN